VGRNFLKSLARLFGRRGRVLSGLGLSRDCRTFNGGSTLATAAAAAAAFASRAGLFTFGEPFTGFARGPIVPVLELLIGRVFSSAFT
jgi:hypothetical protein